MSSAPSPSPLLSPRFRDDSSGFAASGVEGALGSANSWAYLFPLAKNWRVIGACYGLWAVSLLYGLWTAQRIGSGWWWTSALSAPLTHIGAFAFLAPLPWILTRRLPSPRNFILGFALSVLLCESISVLLPLFDAWVLIRGGVQFNLGKLVELYLTLVGPAMIVVGGLVAARARSEELREESIAEALIAKNRLHKARSTRMYSSMRSTVWRSLSTRVPRPPRVPSGIFPICSGAS